mmetsp:Transcript_49226/g.104754  ORF Transcript_49226/g.104754 Transcript_49226/m.104754 type:complete len:168 (-) Transcript_49226:92-595(-)|eukprot:CAMPEP_0206432656 /NCGR_PEP_ID=MMETSP0324_2-20121206/8088_1 /ASSEMBLY_ACC=CAM_ASM_000836 /TAXON_ID=2866 /ORGANISM="Crypthecodinium cohnii, Strain Seligo" /LENGTH=167 /DNA_ID=CAMNT_0053898813 /DNA_START=210 /DNA_END=713 /DNA_ORIENTATION=-
MGAACQKKGAPNSNDMAYAGQGKGSYVAVQRLVYVGKGKGDYTEVDGATDTNDEVGGGSSASHSKGRCGGKSRGPCWSANHCVMCMVACVLGLVIVGFGALLIPAIGSLVEAATHYGDSKDHQDGSSRKAFLDLKYDCATAEKHWSHEKREWCCQTFGGCTTMETDH